jgi:hypothetical protein
MVRELKFIDNFIVDEKTEKQFNLNLVRLVLTQTVTSKLAKPYISKSAQEIAEKNNFDYFLIFDSEFVHTDEVGTIEGVYSLNFYKRIPSDRLK